MLHSERRLNLRICKRLIPQLVINYLYSVQVAKTLLIQSFSV